MRRLRLLSLARLELVTGLSRVTLALVALPAVGLVIASFWLAAQFLHPVPPRRIVLASGPEHGSLHAFGLRYREILARNGIAVDVRTTAGAAENLELLQRPESGVDLAMVVAGTASKEAAAGLVNIANLFPAPLWIAYRGDRDLSEIDALVGRRVAVGGRGTAMALMVGPLLAANGIRPDNTTLVPLPFEDAVRALRNGEVDAALLGESPALPEFMDLLVQPGIRLMDLVRADAYARRYPHVHRMDLPAGTLDFARRIPQRDVRLIGAVVMLAATESIHPTIVDLFVDAAREIHGSHGFFERRGEFPDARRVDEIAVSDETVRYLRTGPSFLRRYLPLWLADFLQRMFTLALPVVVVVLPLLNWIPRAVAALMENRIDDVYEELRLIERHAAEHGPALDLAAVHADMERLEGEVARLRVPLAYSRELYVLRSHVRAVREGLPRLPERTG